MDPLPPLRFRPLFRRYLWGNRRLGTCLGKPIGPGDDYAESWEICDRGQDQSIVQNGPLAGTSLGELVRRRGPELLGRHHPQPRFPLLVKFLDAARALSVQVHPNDAQAAALTPPDVGKTEAWVVLAAEPGSLIYAGLKPGVARADLAQAIGRRTCDQLLHRFQPQPGDCVFLPAGTVHALGQGLLVAEVQQPSDTTYRLYDWGRLGLDGRPRALHVEQGLAVVDFERGPVDPQPPQPTSRQWITRLAGCDKFMLDRWALDRPHTLRGQGCCHVLCVLEGCVRIEGDPTADPLRMGGVVLIPASIGDVRLLPDGRTVLLDCYLPPD
ncbi:MAG: type I phosphomannose isomerase catalytic subunit [Thermoguttaceae bacterium]|jgi:mannose-6-phosphate isomerase